MCRADGNERGSGETSGGDRGCCLGETGSPAPMAGARGGRAGAVSRSVLEVETEYGGGGRSTETAW